MSNKTWIVEREDLLPARPQDVQANNVVMAWLSQYSPSTRKTYGSEAKSFLLWLWEKAKGDEPFPGLVTDELLRSVNSLAVAAYLSYRADNPKVYTRVYSVKEFDEAGILTIGTKAVPSRTDAGVGPVRRNWILCVLRSLVEWLFAYEYVSQDEYARTKIIKRSKGESEPARYMAPDVFQKVMDRCVSDNPDHELWCLRDRTLLAFLWDSGIRKQEAIDLKVEDLTVIEREDGYDHELLIRSGKGGIPRKITWLTDSCLKQLMIWLDRSGLKDQRDAPMFPNLHPQGRPGRWFRPEVFEDENGEVPHLETLARVVTSRFTKGGYPNLYSCHSIRRSACQDMLEKKFDDTGAWDILAGMRFLGHKSPKTTMGYIDEIKLRRESGVFMGRALRYPDANGFSGE